MKVYRDRERTSIRAIVLSDSICKYCHFIPFAILLAVTGAGIRTFIDWQRNPRKGKWIVRDWCKYDLCFINCGTNDLANGNTAYLDTWMQILMEEIRIENPWIKFVILSIIPRPLDHTETIKDQIKANRVLAQLTRITEGAGFYPSYRTFTKNFEVRDDQKMFGRDGLHLHYNGVGRMEKLIKWLITLYHNGRLDCINIKYGRNLQQRT